MTSPDLRRSTLSAAIRICGNPLTDSAPLSKTSLRWIRRPVLSSFSAEEDGTGSEALFREPDGFVLIYKRLSVHGGYQWPRKQSEVRNLSWREFDWLMSGIDIDQPKALKAE